LETRVHRVLIDVQGYESLLMRRLERRFPSIASVADDRVAKFDALLKVTAPHGIATQLKSAMRLTLLKYGVSVPTPYLLRDFPDFMVVHLTTLFKLLDRVFENRRLASVGTVRSDRCEGTIHRLRYLNRPLHISGALEPHIPLLLALWGSPGRYRGARFGESAVDQVADEEHKRQALKLRRTSGQSVSALLLHVPHLAPGLLIRQSAYSSSLMMWSSCCICHPDLCQSRQSSCLGYGHSAISHRLTGAS